MQQPGTKLTSVQLHLSLFTEPLLRTLYQLSYRGSDMKELLHFNTAKKYTKGVCLIPTSLEPEREDGCYWGCTGFSFIRIYDTMVYLFLNDEKNGYQF